MKRIGTSCEIIEGIFVKELKNRFLCEVLIDGVPTVCYVPSSCHLSNFLKLDRKKILLVPTQTKGSKTPYALFAVPYKRNYILLNTSSANRAIEENIHSRQFSYLGKRKSVLKEHTLYDYKSDLYILDSNTIIEVKSILSLDPIAKFPSIYSERTIKQLDQINNMLSNGVRVCFMIVSLHPYINEIVLDQSTEFYEKFAACSSKGMISKAYTARLHNNKISIDKEIPIRI